jgi:hypothetical protein
MLTLAPLVESAPVAACFVQRDVSGELVIVGHNAAAVSLDPEIALRIGRRRAELFGWSAELLALAEDVWGSEVLVHTFTPREADGGDGRTLRATLLEPVPGVVLAWVEDRTATELQLARSEEAQRVIALGRRAPALAADLGDLLTTIAGAASGAEVLSTAPSVREELETIRAAARRAGALIAELLDAPEGRATPLFECNLDDVAASLRAELDATGSVTPRARVEHAPSDWRACLDLGALQHFLGELGQAAVERSEQSALVYALDAVQVGAEGLPDDPAATSGAFLRIRVWDESPQGEVTIAACGFDARFHAGTGGGARDGDALALGYARIRQVGGHARTTNDDAGRSALAIYLPRAPALGPATLPPLDGATLRPGPSADDTADDERATDRAPPPPRSCRGRSHCRLRSASTAPPSRRPPRRCCVPRCRPGPRFRRVPRCCPARHDSRPERRCCHVHRARLPPHGRADRPRRWRAVSSVCSSPRTSSSSATWSCGRCGRRASRSSRR